MKAGKKSDETHVVPAAESTEAGNHDNNEIDDVTAHPDEEEEEEGDEEESEEGHVAGSFPKKEFPAIKLGGREFASPKDIGTHLSKLLQSSEVDKQLSDSEASILVELLEQYHPKAKEKVGAGLTGVVMVRLHPEHLSKCFVMVLKDGKEEDFSFRKCLENVGGSGRRVVKFEGLEPGTPFQNVKDAFVPFGKCFVSMNDGETNGFVKFSEPLSGKKLINVVKKEPLKIGDSLVTVRYLTEEEEKKFWEDQKEATKKAEEKRLNYEKKKGSFQKKSFDKGKGGGGKPFNKRKSFEGGEKKGHDESKRQKTQQGGEGAGEEHKEKKGFKINVPQGNRR